MFNWWRRKRTKEILLVMRLADMHRVHPRMIEKVCCRCQHVVGIYPSGQHFLITRGAHRVDIVCQVCEPLPDSFSLVPGAIQEQFQSVPRK
jgi:hypothetical protein